ASPCRVTERRYAPRGETGGLCFAGVVGRPGAVEAWDRPEGRRMRSESVQGGTAGEFDEVGELTQHAAQRVVSMFEDFQDPSREWRPVFFGVLGSDILVSHAHGYA